MYVYTSRWTQRAAVRHHTGLLPWFLPSSFEFSIQPLFCLIKTKTKKSRVFWAECFMLHWWLSTTAWVRSVSTGAAFYWNLLPQGPQNATWGMCNVVWNDTMEYRPHSSVTLLLFSCESGGIHICTEYSLLCSIWRAAVCSKVETAELLGRCWTRGCRSWLAGRLF